jgi:hypothetical protein
LLLLVEVLVVDAEILPVEEEAVLVDSVLVQVCQSRLVQVIQLLLVLVAQAQRPQIPAAVIQYLAPLHPLAVGMEVVGPQAP